MEFIKSSFYLGFNLLVICWQVKNRGNPSYYIVNSKAMVIM